MCLYIPVKQRLYHRDLGRYTAYGLAAMELSCRGVRRTAWVPDVSVSFRFAMRLAMQCTAGRLSPTHLLDIVEDSI